MGSSRRPPSPLPMYSATLGSNDRLVAPRSPLLSTSVPSSPAPLYSPALSTFSETDAFLSPNPSTPRSPSLYQDTSNDDEGDWGFDDEKAAFRTPGARGSEKRQLDLVGLGIGGGGDEDYQAGYQSPTSPRRRTFAVGGGKRGNQRMFIVSGGILLVMIYLISTNGSQLNDAVRDRTGIDVHGHLAETYQSSVSKWHETTSWWDHKPSSDSPPSASKASSTDGYDPVQEDAVHEVARPHGGPEDSSDPPATLTVVEDDEEEPETTVESSTTDSSVPEPTDSASAVEDEDSADKDEDSAAADQADASTSNTDDAASGDDVEEPTTDAPVSDDADTDEGTPDADDEEPVAPKVHAAVQHAPDEPLRVSPLPPVMDDPAEVHAATANGRKYLSFLTHGGFHNQRIELENAFILAAILNRTLLVPPAWVGWPVTNRIYPQLQGIWTQNMVTHPDAFNITVPADMKDPDNRPGPYTHVSSMFPVDPSKVQPKAPSTPKKPSSGSNRSGSQRNQPGGGRGRGREPNSRTRNDRRSLPEEDVEEGSLVRRQGKPVPPPPPGFSQEGCKSYRWECHGAYPDVFLAWSWLADRDALLTLGDYVERWDVRERSIEGLVGVKPEDIFVMDDEKGGALQYILTADPSAPLVGAVGTSPSPRWSRQVSVPKMLEIEHKVILVGSLFGTQRVQIVPDYHIAGSPVAREGVWQGGRFDTYRTMVQHKLAFRNPYLLDTAKDVGRRLGGKGNFVAVHVRMGEGGFATAARDSVKTIWHSLTREFDVDRDAREELWHRVERESRTEHRPRISRRQVHHNAAHNLAEQTPFAVWSMLDDSLDPVEEASELESHHLAKRQEEPAAPIKIAPQLHSSLRCRGQLHDPEGPLAAFNVPLYIATDAMAPSTNEVLSVFYNSFPCTFTMEDFMTPRTASDSSNVVNSLVQMKGIVSAASGAALGKLMIPFAEAAIAGLGHVTIGTVGSTFSSYAQYILHAVYAEEDW